MQGLSTTGPTWVMVGLAFWHFSVLVPDRFYGGVIGALVAAVAGALVSGYLLPTPGIPAHNPPGLGTDPSPYGKACAKAVDDAIAGGVTPETEIQLPMIIDEDWGYCGMGSGILYRIQKPAFDYLDAPIEYVHSDEIPVPFNHFLEEAMMPSVDRIVSAVKEVCYR